MVETRSKVVEADKSVGSRIAALEELVAEQNRQMTKHRTEMIEAMGLVTTNKAPVNQLSPMSSLSLENQSGCSDPYKEVRSGANGHYISNGGMTRLGKIDFPRFDGTKIQEWLFKAEHFFKIDQTPDELKIGLASSHFDDIAVTWHQLIVQSVLWKHVRHDWVIYKLLLQGKMNKLLDDTVAELKQLQETEGIDEYHARFELISTRVSLDEESLVSSFLAGLRTDTQLNVTMFQPQTVRQCLLIGRLYERAHPTKFLSKEDDDRVVTEEGQRGDQNVEIMPQIVSNLLNVESIHEEENDTTDSIPQDDVNQIETLENKVSIFLLEPSHRVEDSQSVLFKNNDLQSHGDFSLNDLYNELKIDVGISPKVEQVYILDVEVMPKHAPNQIEAFENESAVVKIKVVEHQVFDSALRRRILLQNLRKKTFSKTWRFKFKEFVVRQEDPQHVLLAFLHMNSIKTRYSTTFKHVRLMRQTHMSRLGCEVWLIQTLQDLPNFIFGDVQFQIKHKWRFKFRNSVSELVLCFDSVELSTTYTNSWDFLWTRGSSTVCATRESDEMFMVTRAVSVGLVSMHLDDIAAPFRSLVQSDLGKTDDVMEESTQHHGDSETAHPEKHIVVIKKNKAIPLFQAGPRTSFLHESQRVSSHARKARHLRIIDEEVHIVMLLAHEILEVQIKLNPLVIAKAVTATYPMTEHLNSFSFRVGIDKKHSSSLLQANQIWDPGGVSLQLKLQWSFYKPCGQGFSKGGDLIQEMVIGK